MENFDLIVNAAANYGFPMALSAYLLMRMEARVQQLTDAINKLNLVVGSLKFPQPPAVLA